MRKRRIARERTVSEHEGTEWLDLERIAEVELTSEDDEHPIESAFGPGEGPGWRASEPGEQMIRVLFDEPQRIRRIRVVFEEIARARTQEFVLRWASDETTVRREIVRQQWNFHPHEATREVELYTVDLVDVRVLELVIHPDVHGSGSTAALRSFHVG